jgi:hypothetical protein
MVGLIDIAPRIETVEVQGASVAVHGISAKGVASLSSRRLGAAAEWSLARLATTSWGRRQPR